MPAPAVGAAYVFEIQRCLASCASIGTDGVASGAASQLFLDPAAHGGWGTFLRKGTGSLLFASASEELEFPCSVITARTGLALG